MKITTSDFPRYLLRASVIALSVALLSSCVQPVIPTPPPAAPKPAPRWAFTEIPNEDWARAEQESEMDFLIAPFNPLTGAGPADQIRAKFRGKKRKFAKTHISDADLEEFDDLQSLIDALPTDADMRDLDPPITGAESSDRADEEDRNVSVPTFICAIKYEADQDWHIIGSGDDDCDTAPYFNFEISGLPHGNASAFGTLLEVRESLFEILEEDLPGLGRYRKYFKEAFAYFKQCVKRIRIAVRQAAYFKIEKGCGVTVIIARSNNVPILIRLVFDRANRCRHANVAVFFVSAV